MPKAGLLEGMGCPGGCIGGAGTIADPARTAVALNKYVKEAPDVYKRQVLYALTSFIQTSKPFVALADRF